MRKWLKGILCGALAVSMLACTACGDILGFLNKDTSSSEADPTKYNGKTAAQTYTAIETKIDEAKSGTIETNMLVDAVTEGLTMEITMNMISKSNLNKEYNEVSMEALGQKETAKVWYVGGYLYTHADGYKIKQRMTPQEYRDYIEDANTSSSGLFEVKDLTGVEFVEEEGGVYFVAPLASSEIRDLASSVSGSTIGLVISDIEYLVHIDENSDLRYLELNFDMTQTTQGVTFDYTVECTIYIKDLNKTTVTAPSDASSYLDVSGVV